MNGTSAISWSVNLPFSGSLAASCGYSFLMIFLGYSIIVVNCFILDFFYDFFVPDFDFGFAFPVTFFFSVNYFISGN